MTSIGAGRWCLIFLVAVGCGMPQPGQEPVYRQSSALVIGGLSPANLDLQVSGNSCWGNGAQSYYRVKNNDGAAIKLSDITLKYWVNDTTGSSVVPHVAYGGCVTSANGTCVHPVANVTAKSTQFGACGPDAQHQANWEITISTTDSTTIAPGNTWSNLQTSINLANFAPFTPGSNTWYSSCGTGQPFHSDAHYSVYVKGQLVTTSGTTNGITPPACRAPQGSQPITSYTLPPITPIVGTLPDDQLLTLALSLPVRNLSTLQATIDAAADPSSASYRKWLTPADLQANYFPSATDYATLTAWATSVGLQISSSPDHMVAGLVGTVAQIERALFVNLITAQRADGTIFYAPDRVPTLTVSVPVLGISGIDNFILARPAFSGGTAPSGGGSFQSSDLRGAYLGVAPSACASLTGAGQTIGIFANYAGFNTGDVQSYITSTGLTGVLPVQVKVAGTPDGVTPTPRADDDSNGSGETSLDIDMAIAMAPGAQVVVFEGTNVDLILDDMVNSPTIAQLTSSWTVGASATTTQLHTVMAAQGQAFFEASGDGGSYPLTGVATPPGAPVCASFPANLSTDMPYITLVGGTELSTVAGVYQSETSWNGSAGGVLPTTKLPAWQVNANPGNAFLSTTSRNVPDVSMPGNGIYVVFSSCDGQGLLPLIGRAISPASCVGNVLCNIAPGGKTATFLGCKAGGETQGQTGIFNGTSAATPLWAAFMALVNQRNQAQGKIGFPNPTFYAIGRGANYATSFHDITAGSSSKACDATQYTAQAGYDQVTGWGSPRCGLATQLSPLVTPPQLPRITVAGNAFQLASEPLDLCGGGSSFTPGATITLTMTNVPDVGGVARAAITLGSFTVAADGTFAYSISPSSMPSAINCTDAQRFDHVTLTATDPLQEIASGTFAADFFCTNALTASSFGGGCP